MITPFEIATEIFDNSHPIISINGLGGARWCRNVQKGSRIGPWLQASYSILNERIWKSPGACLYFVRGEDKRIRYIGISRNGVKHRWRLSPALDAKTMQPLQRHQLFHSQCWKHIEIEYQKIPNSKFEVRVIEAVGLIKIISKIGGPLSGFLPLEGDDEGLVAAVERWLCNRRSDELAVWNSAMTFKK